MNPVPPKIAPPARAPVWWIAIFLVLAVTGVAAVIFFYNPATHGFYPVCQFHRLTGLNCPGCGGTRAVYALLHGNLPAALKDNALVVAGIFLALLRGGWWLVNRWRGRPAGEFFSAKFLWPLLAILLVFTVLRNLPAFAFLSP